MDKAKELIKFARGCAANRQDAFAGIQALADAVEAMAADVEKALGAPAAPATSATAPAQS